MFEVPVGKEWLAKADLFEDHLIAKEIYQHPARVKIIVAGRRGGKTVVCLQLVIKTALTIPRAKIWIVMPDYINCKDAYLENLKIRLGVMDVPYSLIDDEKTFVLQTNGSIIEFKSAENDKNLRGRGIHMVVFDEFASIKPKIWPSVFPSIMEFKNSKIIVASNYVNKGIGSPLLKMLFEKGNEANKSTYREGFKSWKFSSSDNPHIGEEEIKLIRDGLTEEEAIKELESDFSETGGIIYTGFNPLVNVKTVELNRNLPLCLSFDFNVRLQTTTISQISDGQKEPYKLNGIEVKEQEKILNIIHCINTSGRVIDIQMQCDNIKKYLDEIEWTGDIHIYGDPAGFSYHGDAVDGCNYWDTVRLNFPDAYYYVPKVHPPVKSRFNAVNRLIKNGNREVGLFINNSENVLTQPLIRDLQEIVWNKLGTDQDKSNADLSHNADNIGYLIAKEFPVQKRTLNLLWI